MTSDAQQVADEIHALERSRRAALVSLDRDALCGLLSEDLRFTHTSGRVDTRQRLLDSLGVEVRFVSIEPIDEQVVLHGLAAVVTAQMHVVTQRPQDPTPLRHRTQMTSVWTRTPDGWRQIAYHAMKLATEAA